MEKLSGEELIALISSVFPKFENDKKLGILVDIPRDKKKDNLNWTKRRETCLSWFNELKSNPGLLARLIWSLRKLWPGPGGQKKKYDN